MKPFGVVATHRQLARTLKRMGLEYDFDPYLPTKQRYPNTPKSLNTPGEPYPPGYYTSQAMASLRFDQWIVGLGRKDKIVPGKKIFVDNG